MIQLPGIFIGIVVGATAYGAMRMLTLSRARRMRVAVAVAEAEAEDREALLHPDWRAFERARGCIAARALQELYRDRALVTREGFVIRDPDVAGEAGEWDIDCFNAATADPTIDGGPQGTFAFATSLLDEPYYVKLEDQPRDDVPVYLLRDETNEEVQVSPSLAAFTGWPRDRLKS